MSRAAIAIVVCLAAPAHAEDVTLDQALAAVASAPATPVPAHELASAEARVAAAGAWPAPTVRIETNRVTARLVAGVAVPLPIWGTVGAARRAAATHADTVRAEGTATLRELRHRVVLAWIVLAHTEDQRAALATDAQQAAELERIARGRLDAGAGADVDVTAAHAARIRAELAVATATHEQAAAAAQLAGELGWDPLRALHAAGPLPGGSVTLDAVRRGLPTHPERIIALRRIAEGEANEASVRVQRRPALAFEVSGSFADPTEPRTDVMLALSLELPVFSRIGDQLRAARAQTTAERARLAAGDALLDGELVATYRRWEAATERLMVLERDVLPAQDRAATLAAQAFREGERDLASALLAERDRAAVRTEIATARSDAATAWIELQLAAGGDPGAH
ncbi:MAG: TolC family protein [Myxococcales bacterium]|nr:TolC family protein [Myxococcales bacterium]